MCFPAHPPSSSHRCLFRAGKHSAHGGSSWSGWAFRNRPEASLTAGKTSLVPRRASGRPGRSCLLVPWSKVFWRIVPNRERDSLMTRLVLLLVTLRKHLLKEILHSCPLHTSFSSTLFNLVSSSLPKALFSQVTTQIWAVLSAGLCLQLLLLNDSVHS